MPNKLINSELAAVFTTDPAVALWTYLKDNWTNVTGYTVPAKTLIKFDTKFGEMKGFFNFVIVENMPNITKPQTVGGSRYTSDDSKRLQILCIGKSAKDTKWKMERHIDSIINGNPVAMQATYGIKSIQLSEFQDIPTDETESTINDLQATRGFHKARSRAIVTLKYEQEAAVI